jgi:hypothetical protein
LGGELERHLVFVIGICRDQLHRNAIYVLFAATGSWLGAFVSVTWLRRGHTEAVQTRHNPP